MPGVPDASDPTWDRFLEFISCSDETVPPVDVEAELRQHGIDIKKAQSRVLAAVQKAKAKAELDRARGGLPAIREAMGNVPSTLFNGNRERLKALIAERCDAEQQMAYFRKLETAATEEDLQSLLADLERLDMIPILVSNGSTTS